MKKILFFLWLGIIPLLAMNIGGGSGSGSGGGDMYKATYDKDENLIVDKAEGLTENVVTETTIVNGAVTGSKLNANLDDLSDVEITSPGDGEVLKYDAVSGKFKNGTGGGSSPFQYSSDFDLIYINDEVANYTSDFVVGSPQLDWDWDYAHSNRMFFDKSNASFRIGRTTGDQWDEYNRGNYSFACGNNTTANGDSSHAEGSSTEASGNSSHAEGGETTASGDYSHAEGYSTTASGGRSHAQGEGTEASGSWSHAEGYRSKAYLEIQHSHASSRFDTNGDAQYSRVVVMASTTDSTQKTMYIGGYSYQKLVVPANTTWGFRINLVARSSTGVSSYWEIKGVIKRDGSNNTILVGSITKNTIAQDSGANSWDATAEANDTDETLDIKVTGASSTNIHWVGVVELTECGY